MADNLPAKLNALVAAMNEGAARMVASGAELPAVDDSLKVTRLMREVRDLLNEYLEEPLPPPNPSLPKPEEEL